MREGRWRLAGVIAALLCAAPAGASTISGTIKKTDGTLVNGRIEFTLSQPGTITSPSTFFVPPPVYCTITLGAIQTSPACVVQDNGSINPAGTTYMVRILDANNRVLLPPTRYTIPSGSVDFPSLPVTAVGTLVPPTGSVTGNFSATGAGTFGGDVSVGGALTIGGTALILTNQASPPGTPGSGKVEIYSKTDKLLYFKDDTGTEAPVGAGGTPGATVAIKPATGDGFRFISGGGNDSNDGLSWGTAKKSAAGAAWSFPGGSAGTPKIAGSGTIYAAGGAQAHPTSGCGFYVMGDNIDPNWASPPTCWSQHVGNGAAISLIGIGGTTSYGPNAHTPQVGITGGTSGDRNKPLFWWSGHVSNFVIKDIGGVNNPGRGMVIGECSNGLRDGTCTGAGYTLDNVGIVPTPAANMGPGLDVVGGFWGFFRNVGFSGTEAQNSVASDFSPAILFDGSAMTTFTSQALFYVYDCNLSNGGIKFKPASGNNSLHVSGCTQEASASPLLWIKEYQAGAGIRGTYSIENSESADSIGFTEPVLKVEGYGNGNVSCGGLASDSGRPLVTGPANCRDSSKGAGAMQSGFTSGAPGTMPMVVAQHTGAAWFGGPVIAKQKNYARTTPSNWNITTSCSSCTLTDDQPNPWARTGIGTKAATVSTSAGGTQRVLFSNGALSGIIAAGGRLNFRVWVKFTPPNTAGAIMGVNLGGGSTFTESGTAAIDLYPVLQSAGGWVLARGTGKIATVSSPNVTFYGYIDSTHSAGFAQPTFTYDPPGVDDNETADYAMNGPTWPEEAPIGSVVVNGGIPFIAPAAASAFDMIPPTVNDSFSQPVGSLAGDWTIQSGTSSLSGTYLTGLGQMYAFHSTEVWPPDQSAQVTATRITTSGDDVGVVVRASSSGGSMNAYRCHIQQGGSWALTKWVAGSQSTIASGSGLSLSNGDVVFLSSVSSTLTCKRNGSTLTTQTDTALASGSPGVFVDAGRANTWRGAGIGFYVTQPGALSQPLAFKRLSSSQGTALVAGDFALSAGWGSGAAVSAVTGTDQGFDLTVTAGTSPTANPTVTLTFKDGTWTNTPILLIQQRGGTGAQPTAINYTPSATAPVITWMGTPVNTNTYIFSVLVIGR